MNVTKISNKELGMQLKLNNLKLDELEGYYNSEKEQKEKQKEYEEQCQIGGDIGHEISKRVELFILKEFDIKPGEAGIYLEYLES